MENSNTWILINLILHSLQSGVSHAKTSFLFPTICLEISMKQVLAMTGVVEAGYFHVNPRFHTTDSVISGIMMVNSTF